MIQAISTFFRPTVAFGPPLTGWQPYKVSPFRRVRLIDGNRAWGPVMRREVMGEMQYRAMTKDEAMDFELANFTI